MFTVNLDLVEVARNGVMPRTNGMQIFNPDRTPYGKAIQHQTRYNKIDIQKWEALTEHLQTICNNVQEGRFEIVLAGHRTNRDPNFRTQVLFKGNRRDAENHYNQLLAELNVNVN